VRLPPRTHIVVQLVTWCAVLAAVAPASAKGGTAGSLIHRLNHERARAGLEPLRSDRRLSRAAARQSRRQLRTGFGHAKDLGVGRGFRRVAELIARERGWRLHPASVALGWRNSPTHRSLVETGSYRLIGVGWARGRLDGSLTTIWTVRLGAR
jgi:uncharacterized protein YkwD